jgi:heme-degrading monooxygenase HmoA
VQFTHIFANVKNFGGLAPRVAGEARCYHVANGGIAMICRVATHAQTPSSITSDEARSFREWLKEQPGFIDGYHAQDSETGRAVSITVWDSRDSMMALRDLPTPGGSAGITTEWFEIYDVVERF